MQDTELDQLITQGLNAYQNGDYLKALKKFEKNLSFRQEDHSVREAAAYTANKAQEWKSAATHWFAVSALNPNRMGPINQYITALLRAGRYKEAKEYCEYSEALQSPANRVQYYSHMISINLANGQVNKATDLAAKGYRLDKSDSTAMKYANCFFDHKLYSETDRWIKRVVDKEKYRDAIDLLQARGFYARHSWKEAEQAWQHILDNQTGENATNAQLYLARIAANAGKSDLAEQRYKQVLQNDRNNEEAITFSIRTHLSNNNDSAAQELIERHWDILDPVKRIHFKARTYIATDPTLAIQVYRDALKKQPTNFSLKLGYATFLLDMNFIEEADEIIQANLRQQPENFQLNKLQLRLMQVKSSPPNLLLRQAEFTLELNSTDVTLLNTVGGLLARNNQRSDAILHYKKAVKISPDSAVLWRNGAYHMATDNRLEEAAAFAKEAVNTLGTTSAKQLTNAAWILLAALKLKPALRYANKAIKLEPNSPQAHEMAADIQMVEGRYSKAWEHIQSIDQLAFPRRSEKIAHLGAQCIAAFRATGPKLRNNARPETSYVVRPVKGLFPEKLFHTIVKQSKPDHADDRQGIIQLSSNLGAGGAERQVAYVMQGFMENPHTDGDCSLVVNSLNPEIRNDFFLDEVEKTGCEITDMEGLRATSSIRHMLALHPEFADRTRQLAALPFDASRIAIPFFGHLIKTRPKTVHLWQDSINVVAGMAAVAAGVPKIVLCTRSTRPVEISRYRRYLKEGYLALLKYSGAITIVNNSANGARNYEDWLGIQPNSIKVFYNGYDFNKIRSKTTKTDRGEIRRQYSIPKNAQVIGGVMRFSTEKRPDLWVETLISAAGKSADIYGVIVGGGPMRNPLIAKVAELGLSNRIFFPGRQTPIEPWMSAMDILFLSSVTEGLPNVLIEAQSLGVPVATMNVGGAHEALLVDQSGFTLEEARPEKLAEQIIDALQNPARMKKMSKVAIEFVNAQFALPVMMRTLKTMY